MKIDLAIGGGSALAASTIPDTALDYSGKFVFAILTAVVASWVSHVISSWLDARKKRAAAEAEKGK